MMKKLLDIRPIFSRICSTFNLHGVSEDNIYLQPFPFSLASRASTWFDNLPENSITTWDDLRKKILKKYFLKTNFTNA